MQPFQFARSDDAKSAISIYESSLQDASDSVNSTAQYLAGGTTLLDLMKLGGRVAIASTRGKRADSKHGLTRWQRPAADSLHVLSGRIVRKLQQAKAWFGMCST